MWPVRQRSATTRGASARLLVCATLGVFSAAAVLAPTAGAQSRIAVVPFNSTVSYGGTLGTYNVSGVAAISFRDLLRSPGDPILPVLSPGDPVLFQTFVGAIARNTTTGQRCPAAGLRPVDLVIPPDPVQPLDFVLSYRVFPINATCRALGSVALRYVVTVAPDRTFTADSATAVNPDY
jgi:hypothetical protein